MHGEVSAGSGRPTSPGGRARVEVAVGLVLALVAALALVAGGSLPISAQAESGARVPGAAPTLVLQCPLGVHRVPLGPGRANPDRESRR